MEWWQDGRVEYNARQGKRKADGSESEEEDAKPPVSAGLVRRPPAIGPNMPVPCILAADPVRLHVYLDRVPSLTSPC